MSDISDLAAAVSALRFDGTHLFGVRLVASTHPPQKEEVDVSVETDGMFSLKEDGLIFRLRLTLGVEILREAIIDIAALYSIDPGYSLTRQTFLDFANLVACPLLVAQANQTLNPLLSGMALGPNIISTSLEPAFRGTQLPDRLSFFEMDELRRNEELSIPDLPEPADI